MDTFHRVWIFGLLALMVGCTGCTVFGGGEESETDQVEDMADNCKHGLKRAEIEQDSDDHTIKIECADPPRYGI